MQKLLEAIRNSILGERILIPTAFGHKPLVYADYTASGRALGMVETIIQREVLPYYANTHTEASFTGARTTQWRESARRTIHQSVNGADDHKVIFCGSGATAAINRLLHMLGLDQPVESAGKRPVVLIGPFEHHSNELPWRESSADVVVIPHNAEGEIDLGSLEAALVQHADRPLVVGSFSAASNVTGIKSDVHAITRLLKHHGALACWDYAAAGPYTLIDMQVAGGLDAVFLSPHKFPGGPGTPGVLVVREHLISRPVPSQPGGGTVSFVSPNSHHYVQDRVRREEGGTPGIVESVRAGLVFKLKDQVGAHRIEAMEQFFVRRALVAWQQHPGIEILGNTKAERLAIFSLRFRCQGAGPRVQQLPGAVSPDADSKPNHSEEFLPYGFVVALLNDLFGIQARGGCSCAGPYAHYLLGIDAEESETISARLAEGDFSARPGWVRLGFNYFLDEHTFSYLLGAILLVASYGERMLPLYEYDAAKGLWRHKAQPDIPAGDVSSVDFYGSDQEPLASHPGNDVDRDLVQVAAPDELAQYLARAESVLRGEVGNEVRRKVRVS